jgi:hypothetical protein
VHAFNPTQQVPGEVEVAVSEHEALAFNPTQQVPGEVEVPPVAGGAVELHQGHFQFRMAGQRWLFLRAEILHQVVSEFDTSVEELAIARGAVIGDPGLQHMT